MSSCSRRSKLKVSGHGHCASYPPMLFWAEVLQGNYLGRQVSFPLPLQAPAGGWHQQAAECVLLPSRGLLRCFLSQPKSVL